MDNKPAQSQILSVKIISPKEDIFNGEALSVSSVNSAGKFDILPEHANFITLVQNVPIEIIKLNKEKVTFTFPLAIIYNTNNKIKIYTDIQLSLDSK